MTTDQTTPLTQVILGLLTPLLLAGGITDSSLARRAAQEAIAACGTGPLVTIAQIVAFAVTALDDLRLSMAEDLSLSMKLRLRGNANALSRTSVHAAETLEHARPLWAEPADPEPTPAPEPVPPALPAAPPHNNQLWANAMTRVAADLRGRAGQMAPAQRSTDRLWAEVLTSVAGDLRQPDPVPAGLSRAELLRTTLMSSPAGPTAPAATPAARQSAGGHATPGHDDAGPPLAANRRTA